MRLRQILPLGTILEFDRLLKFLEAEIDGE